MRRKATRESSSNLVAVGVLAAGLLAAAPPTLAVPSFARQTGLACEVCHTVFPELTHFGRTFKAGGYVLDNQRQVRGVSPKNEELLALNLWAPLSIMVQISDTQLQTPVPDKANPTLTGKDQNGTIGFPQQLSFFYAGKIAPYLGAFLQVTYASDTGTFGMDNTDLRFANLEILPNEQSLVYGLSLNNNPTVSDLWNSVPAWGFPYASTNAGITPLAVTQIDGPLAQTTAGLTAYLYWNESLYAEFGGYRSAKQGQVNALTGAAGPLDGTFSNVLSGLAPYWRLAYEYNYRSHFIEAGLYGINVKWYPGGTPAAPMPSIGPINHFRDVAEDIEYQFLGDQNIFSLEAKRIHENMALAASFANGASANPSDELTTFTAYGTYYYRRKIGGTAGFFSTTGSSDAGLYPSIPAGAAGNASVGVITSANNSPDTKGWIAEVNYLPWLNVKLSLQYTYYDKFNGGSRNYDGAGRSATANNTLYLLLWVAY